MNSSNRNNDYLHFCLLAILLASLPFLSSHKSTFLISRLAIIGMSINWLWQKDWARKTTAFRSNKLLMSFSAYFILVLLSIFYSANTANALSAVEKNLFFLWIPVLLLTSPPLDLRNVQLLLKIFTVSVVVATLICLGYAVHRNNYLE